MQTELKFTIRFIVISPPFFVKHEGVFNECNHLIFVVFFFLIRTHARVLIGGNKTNQI